MKYISLAVLVAFVQLLVTPSLIEARELVSPISAPVDVEYVIDCSSIGIEHEGQDDCDAWLDMVWACLGCAGAVAGIVAGAIVAAKLIGAVTLAAVLTGGGQIPAWLGATAILGAIAGACGPCASDECLHHIVDQVQDAVMTAITAIIEGYEQYGHCAAETLEEEFACLFPM